MSYTFAPNNLNYVTCNRCFYLMYKHKIKIEGGFPAIFNDLDLKQKDFFIEKVTSVISNDLPEGKFYKTVTQEERKKRKKETKSDFNEMEIPALIKSKELNDKNNRKFVLKGKPDLVVKFENDYGILDFKTTSQEDKTDKYKYQLEAYAQIFEFPEEGVPKLFPIGHMGLIQFSPEEIINSDLEYITQKMKMNYYPLKRDTDGFYAFITRLIDVLEMNRVPEKSSKCKKCNDVDRYLEIKKNEK